MILRGHVKEGFKKNVECEFISLFQSKYSIVVLFVVSTEVLHLKLLKFLSFSSGYKHVSTTTLAYQIFLSTTLPPLEMGETTGGTTLNSGSHCRFESVYCDAGG